jgi:NAD(P)-dependent dehydrogenase (short-subunit alcohol dehydrogenase family)
MTITSEKKTVPPALALFSLEGKTALVTGASSGLGKEMAIGLAMAGAELMLVARKKDPLEQLACELKDFPVAYHQADVSDSEQVQVMIRETIKRFDKIDILVNNVGTTFRGPIIECPDGEYDRIIAINQRSCWLCMKYAGKEMLDRGKGGSIINIGSGAGRHGLKNSIPYCTSKGGMVMMTRAAAVEWAPYKIRVNIIMPGTFKTPLLEECIKKEPDYAERFLPRFPVGRFGEPEEIVGLCIYLACDNSAFMTGSVLFVDGGSDAA